jgi:TolA-binding protein
MVFGNRIGQNRSLLQLICGLSLFSICCALQAQQLQSGVEEAGQASNRKALAFYANAADYQNAGAFELAIDEWQKLVDQFPDDPQASTAWHHLGVCNLQRKEPDYRKAIVAFKNSLKDEDLKLREETLINLSWALFTEARNAELNSNEQRSGLEEAKTTLAEFLKAYADGSYVDQALFYLGDIEHLLGNSERSVAYFQKFLSMPTLAESSLRPDAMYALAVGYEDLGKSAQANRYYAEFLEKYASHRLASEVRLRLADAKLSSGNPEEAAKLFQAIVESKEDRLNDYAMLRLGYALSQQGDLEGARNQYQKLLSDFPDSTHAATAALSLGQLLYRSGEYDNAVSQFEKVLADEDAQAADAAHWIATIYLRQNKAERAIELLEKVQPWAAPLPNSLALDLDYADALYALPSRLAEAQIAYAKLASEHAEDSLAPRAAYNAAFAALQLGKLDEARKWAENFLTRYPQDALRNDVAYVAAESLLQQGEHEAAAKAYQKLLAVDPENPTAAMWGLRLGMSQYLAGEYEQAIAGLKPRLSGLENAEQIAEARFILGACELYQEDFAAAIAEFKTSRKSSKSWPSADENLLLLAEAYQRSGDTKLARETLESLVKEYPSSRLRSQAEYKLAQLSASAAELEDAIDRYKKIVADDEAAGFHSFARYGIVWCMMQQEEYAEALKQLQPLLDQGIRDSIGAEAKLAEGVCLRKLGRLDEASVALNTFLETQPAGASLENARYELGLTYTEKGLLDKANGLFEKLLSDSPEYADADKVLYELAWNCQDLGDAERSVKYFDRLANEYPRSEFAPEALYMVAQRLYDQQLYPQAAIKYASVLDRVEESALREKALYKLGWSYFQQDEYSKAAEQFELQSETFPESALTVDAQFMTGECWFKRDEFKKAVDSYQAARSELESGSGQYSASEQVRTLIYLHGGQCYRELEQWDDCEKWLRVVVEKYSDGAYLPVALYELGYCKQKQDDIPAALKNYGEVAENYRSDVAARARFMMGEIYFSQRDFVRAIPEFQRVMYGFGGDRATVEIKNWQVKSAFEAARCSEVLINTLKGVGREKVLETALGYYEFIIDKHAEHELAPKAQARLGELRKLR